MWPIEVSVMVKLGMDFRLLQASLQKVDTAVSKLRLSAHYWYGHIQINLKID